MSTLFEPKGEVAEWRLIFDHLLSGAEFGDVITYDQLADVLEKSVEEVKRTRHAIYRARKEFGEQRRRWLVALPGRGYRVIQAVEHLSVANQHKSKARRQYESALTVSNVTDLSRLTGEQLASFDAQRKILGTLAAFAHAHEQRLNAIEDILRANGMM
jgi:DNA-binding winged helix-turn-helix (wHTH) protein